MKKAFYLFVLSVFFNTSYAEDAPIVLELFTSQGCSSCPAAEAYIGSLSRKREDVLVLSFHVDYWDRLGWKDPYAKPEFTERQYDYSNYLSDRPGRVYTPQIVVAGSRVARVPYQITTPIQLRLAKDTPYTTQPSVTPTQDGLLVTIPEGKATQNPRIWLVGYDDAHSNKATSGENKGRKLISTHTVQHLEDLGTWEGQEVRIPLPQENLPPTPYLAVLVQESGPQRILGMATFKQ